MTAGGVPMSNTTLIIIILVILLLFGGFGYRRWRR
jgi:LPXTG-motif cell wall-anchored protein